ncbi:DUF6588 family protein [Flagellimonas sp. S174]|uniref:DUF6588 family protein n=1 Tax=Flagellimonas sp. S174 TaxID=3410790 RepID=UPI003BF4D1DB
MHAFRKLLLLCFLLLTVKLGAQSDFDFRNYLVLGVEAAEDLASIYLEPLSEGLLYGLTGAWNNTARVKQEWELDFGLVANGSFVPDEKLSRIIDISAIENLEVLGGGNLVSIPTILGSTESEVTFVATRDGEEFIFDAPTGIGLLSTNWLPNAFLQASLGLPLNSEFSLRIFPKISIDEASVGVVGFGLKNELTKSFKGLNKLPVAVSAFVAFTRLDADYDFVTDGFVTGESQSVDASLNSWLFEVLTSTKFPVWNLYGGIGYITGKSNYALKGTYTITTQEETISFENPFDVQASISGLRGNLGGSVRMNRFKISLDYTFQGFNNLALGMHYNILKAK